MTASTTTSKLLKSKGLLVVLMLGNVALGSTIVVQDHIIQAQKSLIRLLFQDAAELTSYRIAAVTSKVKKP